MKAQSVGTKKSNVVPFAKKAGDVGEEWSAQTVDQAIAWPNKSKGGIPDGKALDNVVWFCEHLIKDEMGAEIEVKFNAFDQRTYIRFPKPGIAEKPPMVELDDAAIRRVQFMMHKRGCIATLSAVENGLRYLGEQKRAHPVRAYLKKLEWDGVSRLEGLLIDYLGAERSALNRAIGKAWMVAAVRRVRQPGVKFDGVLTLQGKQGSGKSSFFRILATPQGNTWFNDSLEMGCSPKEVIENATGSWIVELAEMSNKRQAEEVKKFVSIEADRARTAYSRVASRVPRQFVLGATVNREDFLFDDTGNRRFWVVKVGTSKLKALEKDRDQLWAEAAYLEEEGESHNIPEELWPEVEKVAERYRVHDEVADEATEELQKLPQKDVVISASDLFSAIGITDVTKRRGANGRSVAAGARAAGWVARKMRLPGSRSATVEGGTVRCYASPDATDRPNVYRFNGDRRVWEKSPHSWL